MTDVRIELPAGLRPADGRFGSGPSKVRQAAVERLAEVAPRLLGTSHRRPGVRAQVRRVREGLRAFFSLPDGYEVALGNGGATLFWDAAGYCLVRRRSAHAVFGEFSAKFADALAAMPFLAEPAVVASEPGSHPVLDAVDGADLYALTHCETSTGVAMPVSRPEGVSAAEALVAVDATSAAGGIAFDPEQADAYYFSPQKCFGSEGGLWLALLSPAALQRLDEVAAGADRHVPAMLDLRVAVDNARQDQTYNTPAIATLFLMGEQIDWLNEQGGLAWAAKDCAAKAAHLYDWAERSGYARPFVADPAQRSPVVCTIDLDPSVPGDRVCAVLRANRVVDTEAYRKLGRNQVRVAVFPAVDHADVERLTAAIDFLVERLTR
ncbi:MAG TPA: phosphoserine transaminase [Egibacteraceae bacterium]|nr:phosphoserine transaminase [Actinomycetota bacterium]HWB72586.1 phosphoserine transaminase [Egibacteraceae bacterium]